MAIKTFFQGLYARFTKKSVERNWDDDFTVLLQTHEDPYNLEGLELALYHLARVDIADLTVLQRRTLTLYVTTATIEQLLGLLTQARLYIGQRDTMPKNFLPNEALRQRRFDDYFVSEAGHVVSIAMIRPSLVGRITHLISLLRETETADPSAFNYYNRKLRPLYADAFYALQAIYDTKFQ